MSTSSIKNYQKDKSDPLTADKYSPTKTTEGYNDAHQQSGRMVETCAEIEIQRQANPQINDRCIKKPKIKRTFPLSSLLDRSFKFLTKDQIDEQTRRFQHHQLKRGDMMRQKKEQLQIQEKMLIKPSPELTSKTKLICQSRPNDPLYIRYNRQIEKSQKTLQNKIQLANKLKQQQEQLVLAEIAMYNQRLALKKTRSSDEFFEDMVRWKCKKQQLLQKKREQLQQRESDELTLQPQIGKRSRKVKRLDKQYLQDKDPRAVCQWPRSRKNPFKKQ